MSLMLSKTHDAFRSASGVSDEQAREAAEEIARPCGRVGSFAGAKLLRGKPLAAFDSRLLRVEIKLNLLITLGASTLVGVGLILLRLFVFN